MKKPSITVFCDFDGTITTRDTVDYLLETLATPEWREVEEEWVRGDIGSRECMGRQIPMIQGGWSAVEKALEQVKIDPTFAAFATWCRSRQIPLVVVSEGMDRVIRTVLQRDNITVDAIWANRLEVSEEGKLSLAFPHASEDPECRSGLCKCEVLTGAKTPEKSGRPLRVVIGDGMSDRCWAASADLLFAKSKLRRFCEEQKLPHLSFDDFHTIQNILEPILTQKPYVNFQTIQEAARPQPHVLKPPKDRVAL